MNTNRIPDGKIERLSPDKTRRLIYTDNLMMAVWDFYDGPWEEPEAPHSHPQEQIVYVAEGAVNFSIGEETCRLNTGDTIAVPGDAPHSVQLLTPKVRLIDTWTPIRKEFL